jgi:hypothetical protein
MVGKTFEVVNKIEILIDNRNIEGLDTEADEQLDSEIWSDWSSTYAGDESGTIGRKLALYEYMESNDGTKQQVHNNNASEYNYENSLIDSHIMQENASQSTNSASISSPFAV